MLTFMATFLDRLPVALLQCVFKQFVLNQQEPCSASMDLRRWSDRKTLRGLRWLLRAVCLDYPDLCARVMRDGRRPLEPRRKERRGKIEKSRNKAKEEK